MMDNRLINEWKKVSSGQPQNCSSSHHKLQNPNKPRYYLVNLGKNEYVLKEKYEPKKNK